MCRGGRAQRSAEAAVAVGAMSRWRGFFPSSGCLALVVVSVRKAQGSGWDPPDVCPVAARRLHSSQTQRKGGLEP
jgi:CBS-domain-containing membrane protein